ncbi:MULTISPECIES: hypothetical protein [Sorangium]|uniref:Uncharacterized protein n=1 Tax=Sorangium cellulosum TaxID=56 RepID=A0A4P2QLN4_SORCE|nr:MULTISPECIES: hypothetical protein [Sorangium]AUX30738.1 uncharacterized protein SOCE836_028490 [Sorangium cellulosum]AUX35673.1 uncharacterized protein SOCE836_078700 [Sorangium cellulosum]WCQ90119.1 hypothetical protein NQZ70_02820 [Sorangium sp. Soce836]WCQ94974.1 hypothetical protein NQZ70_07748 [Sorangium sp. Soce836]
MKPIQAPLPPSTTTPPPSQRPCLPPEASAESVEILAEILLSAAGSMRRKAQEVSDEAK